MNRYLLKFSLSTAAVICAYFAVVLYVPGPIKAEYWVHELIVIKRYEAAALPSPKIIFVGGSSTLFNVDAARMSHELNVPVMNAGLHAGLRLDRILEEASRLAQHGDNVILTLEQPYYACNNGQWTDWQLDNTLAWDHSDFDRLSFMTRVGIVFNSGSPSLAVDILTNYVRTVINPERMLDRLDSLAPDDEIFSRYLSGVKRTKSFVYSAYNIDDHGMIEMNEGAHFEGMAIASSLPDGICAAQAQVLATFIAAMKARSVKVSLAYVPYLIEGEVDESWRKADASFRADVAALNVPLIGAREDGFMDRAKFYNTQLHLNTNGRKVYTDNLIAEMRK
ncbi:MAG: hypothetical protein V4441_04990 [Pseudomonadota bacterium]